MVRAAATVAMGLGVLLSCLGGCHAAKVTLVEVMGAGSEAVGCTQGGCKYTAFRIPGLVAAGNNTLIAFAEGRKFSCGDFGSGKGKGQHDMVTSRSTDGGQSWGPLTNILDALSFGPWKAIDAESSPDDGNAVWDPTPLWDSHTGTTWLFFNGPGREAADCANGLCSTWSMQSTDNGATWTEAKNMTTQCQRPGPKPGRFAGNTPGNGHGVQLSTGRLVVPMYGGTPAGASICYSDDHGQSWKASPFSADTGANADEIEVAELNPAADAAASGAGAAPELYMTIRNDGAPGGHRQYSTSTDLGLTWSERESVQVPDPGCKGGVVQAPSADAMVLATAASCKGRVNQTVFLSKKNGAPGSWEYRQFVDAKSGYSTLQMTEANLIANLYEKGGCSFSLALIDPKEMIADGPQGYIPCAQSGCDKPGAKPPSTPPNPKIGYCEAPPPPPPSAACQKVLDAFCNNFTNPHVKSCYTKPTPTNPGYKGYLPLYARDTLACTSEPKKPWTGPGGNPSGPCQGVGSKSWRCYSALALDPDKGGFSNKAEHPNAYCSAPSLAIEALLASAPECKHAR